MKEQNVDSELNSNFAPAVFPADIMYDKGLDSTERWILTILFTYTNAHTNTVFPSYKTIADRSGFSRRTCIRTVEGLIDKNYISKKEAYQKSKDGKINQTSNKYSLYFKTRGSDTVSLGGSRGSDTVSLGGSDTVSPKLSNIELSIEEEEEEEKFDLKGKIVGKENEKEPPQSLHVDNVPQSAFDLARECGATQAELDVALDAMSESPKVIKNKASWLRKALKDIVSKRAINDELNNRPIKPKAVEKRTVKAKMGFETEAKESNKYDKFYL